MLKTSYFEESVEMKSTGIIEVKNKLLNERKQENQKLNLQLTVNQAE